jgi:hypothetical protein
MNMDNTNLRAQKTKANRNGKRHRLPCSTDPIFSNYIF